MKGHKVLVDANILVSASIFYTSKEFGLKHMFYDKCKTLINFFKKNIDRKIGFYTKLIDVTSNRVLSDATLSAIKDSQSNSTVDEEKLLEVFSVIYSESLRRLEENKDHLVRETVNEDKVKNLMGQVLLFFHKTIKKEIEKQNPKIEIERVKRIKASSGFMKLVKSTKIEEAKKMFLYYGILKRKFIDDSPGIGDIELMAQAIYFNELYSKDQLKFYLTSTDYHFVEINKNGKTNDFVPKLIEEKLGVDCLTPEQVLDAIR